MGKGRKKLVVRRFCYLAILFSFACSSAQKTDATHRWPAAVAADSQTIFLLSDMHFDPFYDESLVPKLVESDFSAWESIFESSLIKQLSPYGQDTNYPLLAATVSALQQQSKHPSAIVISGDFLRHKFNLWIQKKKWPYDSERLARKTMQFVALFIRQRFPQTQILTTLGNNDSGCDDYASTPYSEFNRAFADIWEPAMDHGISAPGAHDRLIQSFAPLGDYSVPLQAANAGTKVRVIAYNGIYGTPRYKNKCGDPKESSAAEELAWLKSELEASRQAGERVWLLTHVPLGRDIATLLVKKKHKGGDEPFDRSKHCAQHDFIGMLQEPVELEFEKLLQSYAGTIQTVLAGHTHLNEFRIYPGNIPALITPSIGPIHGNNPAFAVLAYDAKAGRLEDSRVFYLNLNTATRSDQPWALEYDFQDLYQQPDLSAASLTQALAKNKTTSPVEIFQWAKLLNSQSAPPDYLSNHWDLFVCAVDHLSREEFEKCVCTPQKQQAP